LCFIVHRYQRFNDNLLTCFIQLVKQYSDEAKATAKGTVYEYRRTGNQDLPKAGEVLKSSLPPMMKATRRFVPCKKKPLLFLIDND
jgi:hypothetical protein